MVVDEKLFVGTSSDEHVEMYLKAMWLIKENGESIKISSVAQLLRIRQPSVVQMKRLDMMGHVTYRKFHITLTDKVEKSGANIVRKSRLL